MKIGPYPRPRPPKTGLLPAPKEAPKPQQGRKKALLIGINYQPLPERDNNNDSDKEYASPQYDSKMSPTTATSFAALKGPQRDVLDMQKLLIGMLHFFFHRLRRWVVLTIPTECYQYKIEDMVVLIEKEGYKQPTRANIVRFFTPGNSATWLGIFQIHEMKELVKDAQPGDYFFFHCTLSPKISS